MGASGDNWQPVLDTLGLLKRGWPADEWAWDERFTMLASSFGTELELRARAAAAQALPYAWNQTTIKTAPESLRDLCDRTGGLRSGQLLMAGKAGPLVLYGLWWPWGGGTMITLRLGLGEYATMERPYPQVRALFGVRL